MASTIYLASPVAAAIHLAATTPTRDHYSGSGTPWTTAADTPFRLAMNDQQGRYQPLVATQQAIYGGGPPFRFGQLLMYTAEGNVVEQVAMNLYATNHNNNTTLVRLLREALNTTLQAVPCTLVYQPDGASNAVYFAIFHADVQEDPRFTNDENGQKILRVNVTWTRAPHGYAGSGVNTLVNNQTIENDGTGTPDNKIALSTPTGDLLWSEGAPLNMTLKNSNTSLYTLWLATTIAQNYTSINTAKTTSSSTSYVTGGTSITLPAGTRKYRGMKLRALARFHTFTNLSKIQFQVVVWDTTSTFPLLTSKKIAPQGATASFIDFGKAQLDRFFRTGSFSPTVRVEFFIYSIDGTSVTATLDYFELLCYFDFCRIDRAINAITSVNYLQIEQFTDVAGAGYRASDRPGAYSRRVTGDIPVGEFPPIGRLPRAREYDGGNMDLWLAWTDPSDDHDKADQLQLTVEQAPIFYSLRGNG